MHLKTIAYSLFSKRKVAVIIGTRPEAIKMAPVIHALRASDPRLTPVVISTGQHRDMLDQTLSALSMVPDHDLNVMRPGQTLTELSSRLMLELERALLTERPDMVLIQGDTTTALMACMTAYYLRIPIGHIEAGLRTNDIYDPFPEEGNRALISQLAALHFAPTHRAYNVLTKKQHIDKEKVFLTGNTSIDTLKNIIGTLSKTSTERPYILVTLHRRENIPELSQLCDTLKKLAVTHPEIDLIMPVHKNPQVRTIIHEQLAGIRNIRLTDPLMYTDFVQKMVGALFIMTDSGGVQEEVSALGIPTMVLRKKTERMEGTLTGPLILTGTEQEHILDTAERLIKKRKRPDTSTIAKNPFGDGHASARIIQAIHNYFSN